MKKCSTCKELKPIQEFSRRKDSKDGYAYLCKGCRKSLSKEWRKSNLESRAAYQKSYREGNLERVKSINNKSRSRHLEKRKAAEALYWRTYYATNKEAVQERNKAWYQATKKARLEYAKHYQSANRDRMLHIIYWRQLLTSTLVRVGTPKSEKTISMLGYSATEFKHHLDSLGMDWKLHHIDHKIPVSWFKPNTPPRIVNDLRNIHPLSAEANLTKGNRYAHEVPEDYRTEILEHIKEDYLNFL